MKKKIDNLIINIFKHVFEFQKKKHQKRMQKLNKKILSASLAGKKIHTSSSATLVIENNSKLEKKANEEKILKILDKNLDKPEKIFEYIKGAGTKVYKIKFADKILSKIKEKEGFIYPKKGLKALYLNLILNHKLSFKTSEMFVLSSFEINSYSLCYQFYNWYCFKMKINGFEEEIQEQFKNVFEICETNKINSLSFEEMMNLKSAIKRDVEAIDFVKKVVQLKNKFENISSGEFVQV